MPFTDEIKRLEKKQVDIEDEIKELKQGQEVQKKDMDKLNNKVENLSNELKGNVAYLVESNKHLREVLNRQDEQIDRVLTTVLQGNQETKKIAEERENLKLEGRIQFWTSLLTTGGVLYLLAQHLLGG